MSVVRSLIDPTIRLHLGRELAALYDVEPSSMPLFLIEQMARFAVAEAMAEYERSRQGRA